MANVVPVSSIARTRILILMGIGLGLIAAVWLGLRPKSRGVSYYFPTWVGPGGHSIDWENRFDDFTNVTQGLPVVLAALERNPSSLGDRWEKMKVHLPASIQERLPSYSAPNSAIPLVWPSMFAGEPEVAQAVVGHWSHWTDEIQYEWLLSHAPKDLTNRLEYVPLLRTVAQSTNEALVLSAAALLAGYRPLGLANAASIARSLATRKAGAQFNWDGVRLTQTLCGLDAVPPPITTALEEWLTNTGSMQAALAALTLGHLEPTRFPSDTTFEPRFFALAWPQQARILDLLIQPEFRNMVASAWGVSFLKNLLTLKTAPNQPTPPLARPALRILEDLGPVAVGSAPAILPLLSHTNQEFALTAARSFASVALDSPEFIPVILPHLTNRNISAPLLLWLTALGPLANPAKEAVVCIAFEKTLFATQSAEASSFHLDPILVRRYGLIPRTGTSKKGADGQSTSTTGDKPSDIRVWPSEACPQPLTKFWPLFERSHRIVTQKEPHSSQNQHFTQLFEKLPQASLAELARRCLTNMTSGPSP